MNVETLSVVVEFAPGDDVRRAEESWIGDAGERASALPVVHEAVAEDVLADPLDDETFGFGGFGKLGGLLVKDLQRRVRETVGELVEARQDGVEFGEGGKRVAVKPRTGDDDGWQGQFRRYARMVEGEEPRTLSGFSGQPDGALRSRGTKGGPAVRFTKHPAEAVLPRGFVAFLADDEWLRSDWIHNQV